MCKKLQQLGPKIALLIPLSLGIFLILVYLSYHLAYWQKIYPGVAIAGRPMGNQSLSQAQEKLEFILQEASSSSSLILTSTEQTWPLELVSFQYQPEKSLQKAWQIGRASHSWRNLQQKITTWQKGVNIPLDYTLNQDSLNLQIDIIAHQIFIPTVEPTLKITEDNQIIIEPGQDGQELNQKLLLTKINQRLNSLNFIPLELPLIKTTNNYTPAQIDQTQNRAEKFLGKTLTLSVDETLWELDDQEIVQLLSFTNGFNQEKIASWSATLAQTVDRPPQNAAFEFSQGRVTQFRAARNGRQLEQQKTIDLIAQSLAQLENNQENLSRSLPIIIIPPQVTTAEVNTLGIQELVGQGVSYFSGSISSRIHNLNLAATKLNGLLIPPGQVFSFNNAVGDISLATGFKQAYIIEAGRTVLGDGGGVCQVSTTLFRAALDAGLPIIERRAHAYRVGYYEQKSPVGLDATVFAPTADLKFKNDTLYHLLIQSQTNHPAQQLIFKLYGTNDGRTVTLSKSRIWDQVPPPPDLYQDDPTLPTGQVKQIDWQAWGAKVSFDYRVERFGEVLQNRTFYSRYRPWQAIYLRGTGG